jgi:hypothetical protein
MTDEIQDETQTSTATLDEIAPNRASRYVKRWRQLQNEQAAIDYEVAALADEIRQEFPKTPQGSLQFRTWVREHFNVTSSRARRLQEAAKGYAAYPGRDTWKKVGGWASVGFLMGFKTVARNRIFKESLKVAEESKHGSIGQWTVRKIAADFNLTSERKVGRPTRTTVEEALATLRTFIASLYENFNNLPALPDDVKLCLKSSKLAKLAKDAKKTRAKAP